MKILHVCGSFPPAYAYGGPPHSIQHLTSALAERGHDVTVYTTDAKDADDRVDVGEKQSFVSGVEVRRFRNLSNRLAWRNIQLPPLMLPSLLSDISNFDIIHSHEFRSPPSVFAHFAAERAGVPHIHQPRGSVPRYELEQLKKPFDFIIGKRFMDGADRLIASSQIESSNYTAVFPDLNPKKISHVPNGISPEFYQDLPTSGEFRSKYNIGYDEQIILFLSRLHPRKGGDLLIEAISDLSVEDIRLVFVGPDEGARESWEMLAKQRDIGDRTLFVGPLYDVEKLEAYVDAEVFVLPSKNKYESFGNVVLEAMACGTSAVTTDVCGVSEWLDHDNCHSVAPRSSALRDAIRKILTGKPPSSSSLQQYIWENFTWRDVAIATETIYEDVLQ